MADARDTLPARFFANARRFASRVFHHYPSFSEVGASGRTTWIPVGWATAANLVRDLASGLIAMGHQPSEPVAILSGPRREQAYCELAVLAAGGISVNLPITLDGAAHYEMLAHSDARICIVEKPGHLDKIIPHLHGLPLLRHIVVIAGDARGERVPGRVLGYDQVLSHGRRAGHDIDSRVAALGGLDAAMFLYTPGTTGPPRCVMLTHGNLSAGMAAFDALGWGPGDIALEVAPISHGLARIMELHGVWAGVPCAYPRSAAAIADAARIQPTVVISGPAAMEGLVRDLHDEVSRSPGGQKMFLWASQVAHERATRRRKRLSLLPGLRAQIVLARRLLFDRLASRLGGRVHTSVTMGGQCAHGIGELCEAAGIRLICGWGMTETCFAGALRRPEIDPPDSVGIGLPGVEIELAHDGELSVRGSSVFSGYYKAESETAAAFGEGGFLRTGDVAEKTPQGGYRVLGRKRDIIVLDSGRRVAPQPIEAWLRGEPHIDQVIVVGHGRPYLAALFAVSDTLRRTCDEQTLLEIINEILAVRNVELERAWQIRRFGLLPHALGVATGELTPAFEIKRDVVAHKFGYLIDELYE